MKRDLYQEITDKVLADLQAGAPSWVKQWSKRPAGQNAARMPINAISGKRYRGINILTTLTAAYEGDWTDLRFMTFKQAKALGGCVQKGAKGTIVFFFKMLKVEDRDTGEETEIPMMKHYHVFNIAQIDGLPEEFGEAPEQPLPDEFSEFIELTGAAIRYTGGQPCFVSHRLGADNWIEMPLPQQYTSVDQFRCTLLHELTHWTGHRTRLDRDQDGKFGSTEYAFEELVAELGAAFLCAEFGIDGGVRHASYIDSWIKLLKHDKRAYFRAAREATAACEWLRAHVLAKIAIEDQRQAA